MVVNHFFHFRIYTWKNEPIIKGYYLALGNPL